MKHFVLPTQLTDDLVKQVNTNIEDGFANNVSRLCTLVRIPGIAWESFDAANLQASAEAVQALFESTGVFDSVEIVRAKKEGSEDFGSPAILASRAAKNGKPHILLYAHHDVQPPGDAEKWLTPSFEPTLKDGRIYGRGAADDKAGIVTHLAAIETLKNVAGEDFDLGLSLFIEGEEEAGSLSFRNFLEDNRAALAADAIVVADSGNFTTEIPALTTTLRGLAGLVFEVQTLDHALHSGMFGGAVPDAMTAMLKILASFHDEKGSVAVEGLKTYESMELPYDEAVLREESGLLDGVSTIGQGSLLSRVWGQPALTVIGLDAVPVALASNTLQPAINASISLRLAPGDDPISALEALKRHILAHAPWGAKVTFKEVQTGKPFAADTQGWAAQLAKQALAKAFARESVEMGIGGSIPFIADLVEVFPGAQILVTGVEDPDSRAHSPNESVHLESLKRAMAAEALLLLGANDSSLQA